MLPNKVYNELVDEELRRIMRRIRNARTKTVVHHETCPCCGRKLVNLYRKSVNDKEWKCKACWDKEEQNMTDSKPNLKKILVESGIRNPVIEIPWDAPAPEEFVEVTTI